MKKFVTFALIAFMFLSVFTASASAAAIADTVEVRSEVYEGADIAAIVAANGGTITIDATSFAGFFYDIDDDVKTETLLITAKETNTKGNKIAEGDLKYIITPANVDYEFEAFGSYSVAGFFAEEFIPVFEDQMAPDNSVLAKLILDSDDDYTLRTGEELDLGNGYAIEARQVDVDGKKALLTFTKDGEFVENKIVTIPDQGKAAVWSVTEDVKDISDAVVAKIQVDEVLHGAVESIVQIEGIWLIDYENATEIETGDEFGKFDVDEINSIMIVFESNDDITLDEDSLVNLYGNLNFRVADPSDVALRFFAVKELTEPGTYEIRGSVATGIDSWDATNFAGFYYDADNNVKTESLVVKSLDPACKIVEGDLVYTITPCVVDYEFEAFGIYSVAGFFAEEFVPVFEDKEVPDNSVLAKLILDSDDDYTLRIGDSLDLGAGYSLEVRLVEVDGTKVLLAFTKDGDLVEEKIIIIPDQGPAAVWDVTEDIGGITDAVVAKVQVGEALPGADSMVQIEGLWLIDYENAIEIDTGDEFGEFDVDDINSNMIVFESNDDITLDKGSTVDLARGLAFRVADNHTLRYYPFVKMPTDGDVIPDWISWDDPKSDGGARITTAELQQIIYYWLNDLSVHPEE